MPVSSDVPARYFRGYPRRHLRGMLDGIAGTLGCLVPLLALALAGVVGRLRWFRQTRSWIDIALAAVALAFAVLWIRSIGAGIADSLVSRIVPYFRRRVGLRGLMPFKGGEALARNCRSLDELASRLGVEPLSSFGFADDRRGETLQWHDAEAGL